jgi:hypothetical protein
LQGLTKRSRRQRGSDLEQEIVIDAPVDAVWRTVMNWPQERWEAFVEEQSHGWATHLGRLPSLVGRPAPDQVR